MSNLTKLCHSFIQITVVTKWGHFEIIWTPISREKVTAAANLNSSGRQSVRDFDANNNGIAIVDNRYLNKKRKQA